jgi:hypothetical protein
MKPTARLSRHAYNLQTLAKASPKPRRKIISQASDDFILALVDAAKKLIKGEISLTPQQLGAVRRHRHHFEKVTKPRVNVKEVKKACQIGGFLPALLGPLLKIGLPILSGVLGLGQR